jgi:predicted small secreted protein
MIRLHAECRRADINHHYRELTMNTKTLGLAAIVAAFSLTLAACEQEGPAERAGKAVDNAVDTAGDKIEDAGDKVKDAVDDAKK